MPDVTDLLWQESQGDLIDRVHELEGLLASTTRQLESVQRELANAREELDTTYPVTLAELKVPEHLAALDAATERLALDLSNAGAEADLWQHTDQGETRLAVLASSINLVAAARDRLTPKPLPPLGR